MLFRCNILALVGGGDDPAFLKNKVILWDDHLSSQIGELTFKSDVKAVKLRREKFVFLFLKLFRIVVVLETSVYVYNFDKLEKTHKIDTIENPKGLTCLSSVEDIVLAFPHTDKGKVQVNLLSQDKSHIIPCHDGKIACMALNIEGTLLATASEKVFFFF
jgi:WD repeat-containing protein 45